MGTKDRDYRFTNYRNSSASQNSSINDNRVFNSYGALELMARDSINSVGRLSNLSSISKISQTVDTIDEKNWNWKYLRDQFRERDIETQCKRYEQRLRGGYFSVYLLLNFGLFLSHVVIILLFRKNDNYNTYPDVALYIIASILPLSFLGVKQKHIVKYNWLYPLLSCLVIIILVLCDLLVPVIGNSTNLPFTHLPLRPAYVEHTLLGCYAFLPIEQNFQATVLGITITVCHLFVLWVTTYSLVVDFYPRIISDLIYLCCINGIGLYLRFLNEIVIRRMFLDGRKCVQTTIKLRYQKKKEDRLMLSILPPHVKKLVQSDIEKVFALMNNNQLPRELNDDSSKPFDGLYIEHYNDVTILYADIVNYTKMTSTVPVKTLVEILNELFGKFDDASEDRKVVRIKFLGDCYYCVAGIPQVGDKTAHLNHAQKCVDFGLDMISIIGDVREAHDLDIDMRIGIHSGRILSGLVGSCKWQYDIWSKDVAIANRMEQTGKPGKVHLTHQTFDLLKSNKSNYDWERGFAEDVDKFLAKNNIITYLITPVFANWSTPAAPPNTVSQRHTNLPRSQSSLYDKRASNTIQNRLSLISNRTKSSIRKRKMSSGERFIPISNRRSLFMDDTNKEYQEMINAVDMQMDKEIEKLPLSKLQNFISGDCIASTFLLFNWNHELAYIRQPDPLFKYYLCATIGSFLSIFFIQCLTLPSSQKLPIICFVIVLCVLLICVPLTWSQYFWANYLEKMAKDRTPSFISSIDTTDQSQTSEVLEPKNKLISAFSKGSQLIVFHTRIRTFLYILLCSLMGVCVLVNLSGCKIKMPFSINTSFQKGGIHSTEVDKFIKCIKPWHITQTVSLVILTCFIFLRIHFLLKLTMAATITGLYSFIIWKYKLGVFRHSEAWNSSLSPELSHILSVCLLTITLHVLDRQHEYMSRLDYQWKVRLNNERDEAEVTDRINSMLLQNILPIHVAQIYMNPRRERNTLYYEEYNAVAVMFASLTEYTLGVDDDNEEHELVMLGVLNNIICDFDSLLMDHEGVKVEKIKMAGWTYMAACGLEPGKRDSHLNYDANNERNVVLTMIKLAVKLLKALVSFNKETQQEFKLRIGISHGKVSAGVVGAKKPLYDIWGDTVNMASRMDSTGVSNRIQVTADTAKVLQMQHIDCECRGNIFVKGKNMVRTYFVNLDENFDLVIINNNLSSQS